SARAVRARRLRRVSQRRSPDDLRRASMNERGRRGHSTRMNTKTVLGAFAIALTLASAARADEAAPLVDLDVRAPGFDVAVLRARLAVSLGQGVSAPGLGATIHLFVTEIDGKIIVGLSQGARQVTRQVELSKDHAVAEETLELLLVAMMRQE